MLILSEGLSTYHITSVWYCAAFYQQQQYTQILNQYINMPRTSETISFPLSGIDTYNGISIPNSSLVRIMPACRASQSCISQHGPMLYSKQNLSKSSIL